jgi:hypothetical protein
MTQEDMRYIKMSLFFLGALLSMALIGCSGIIGIIGVYGVVVSLWEYCPEVLIGLGLLGICVVYIPIGWSIFCKCADKLKNS